MLTNKGVVLGGCLLPLKAQEKPHLMGSGKANEQHTVAVRFVTATDPVCSQA